MRALEGKSHSEKVVCLWKVSSLEIFFQFEHWAIFQCEVIFLMANSRVFLALYHWCSNPYSSSCPQQENFLYNCLRPSPQKGDKEKGSIGFQQILSMAEGVSLGMRTRLQRRFCTTFLCYVSWSDFKAFYYPDSILESYTSFHLCTLPRSLGCVWRWMALELMTSCGRVN